MWEGNHHADHLAKEAARAVHPPAPLVQRRLATLGALKLAQRVITAVQGKVLSSKRVDPAAFAAKAKRQRTARQALIKRLHRPKRKRKVKPDLVPVEQHATHPGVHQCRPALGPQLRNFCSAYKRVSAPCRAVCDSCQTVAPTTAAWNKLAVTLCPATAAPGHQMERRLHDVTSTDDGWQCVRCLIPILSNNRAKQVGARCPVPVLVDAEAHVVVAARAALRACALHPRIWRAHNIGTHRAGLAPPPAVHLEAPPPPEPLVCRLVWRSHLPVTGGRLVLCIRCGQGNTAREPRNLTALPCPGYVRAAGRLQAGLSAGTFDACLASASATTLDLARFRGWTPPPALPGPG